jgi:type II secretory pathway component PulF
MEQIEKDELIKKLAEQELKIDAIYKSVEKTRKYFLIAVWATIIAVVLPLIGLIFVIPSFISTYTSTLSSLGL